MNTFRRYGRALLMTAAFGALCLSGCGGGDRPSALVGQWMCVEQTWMCVKIEDGMELFKDGTGVINGGAISWKTEGKRFVLTFNSGITRVGDYNLSGYMLTYFIDKDSVIFVRKEKSEEYYKKKVEEVKKDIEKTKSGVEQRFAKISDYFTDSRNGQKYRTVKIGGQTWMAENLNYQTGNSWCYCNGSYYCEIYGRLYDWNTAKTACPAGWHLPSREEWGALVKAAGGGDKGTAGKALKSTSGWDKNGNGTDSYGFSAEPVGSRHSDGSLIAAGNSCGWWTATEYSGGKAYMRGMADYGDEIYELNGYDKGFGLSVRCVAD